MTEHTPIWTPEEIAALIDDLIEDPAERERLEAIIAIDPEAQRWAEDLRADREALDDVFRARLDAVEPAAFQRAVMERLAEEAPVPKRSLISLLRRPWVPVAMAASLVLVFFAVPTIMQPDLTWTPPEVSAAVESPAPPLPPANQPADASEMGEAFGASTYEYRSEFFADQVSGIERSVVPGSVPQSPVATEEAETFGSSQDDTWEFSPAEIPLATTPGFAAPAAEPTRGTGSAGGTSHRDLPQRVSGRVITDTGEPVAEGVVVLDALGVEGSAGEPVVVGATVTDFDGDFAFSQSEMERIHEVAPDAVLHAEVQSAGRARARQELDDRVEAQDLYFELPAGHSLVGQVTDENGAPVAGATVLAFETSPASGYPMRHEATTDDFGNFDMDRLGMGSHYVQVAEPEGTPMPQGTVDVSGETALNLSWRGDDRYLIAGLVLGDETQQPHEGEVVFLRDPNAPRSDQARLARRVTDLEGQFAFRRLAPDVPLEVELHSEIATRATVDGQEVDPSRIPVLLSEVNPTGGVTISLPESHALLGVAVEAETNEPIENLDLFFGGLASIPAVTDEHGRFVVEGLPPGPDAQVIALDSQWFIAESNNAVFPRRLNVPMNDGPVTIEMERGYPLSVETVTERGRAVANAEVRLLNLDLRFGLSTVAGITDEAGQTQIAMNPDAGDTVLLGVTSSGDLGLSPIFASRESVRIVFPDPGLRIVGQVTRLSSEVLGVRAIIPQVDELVTAASAFSDESLSEPLELRDPGLMRHARTDTEGHFEFSGLPYAAQILRVGSPVSPEWSETIDPREAVGGEIERIITLQPRP